MFKKPHRKVKRVFIHCSASDVAAHDDVKVIDLWHRQRGWYEIGYHYFITKAGTLQKGRSLESTPAAQRWHNRKTIAICLHGLLESKFTNAQFNTLKHLCRIINWAYADGNKVVTFHGHCEVAAKACPVFDYKKVLDLTESGFLDRGVL